MGRIIKELEIAGDKGKRRAVVLFDTGASRSLIRWDVAEDIATILKAPVSLRFIMGDGKQTLTAEHSTDVYFTIKGYTFFHQFFVVPQLAHEMIIGADAMQVWKIVPVPEQEDIIIHPELLDLELVFYT